MHLYSSQAQHWLDLQWSLSMMVDLRGAPVGYTLKGYYEPRAQEFPSRREYMETDIESIIREGRWNAARRAITIALRSKPTSHWLIARLGLTYYEQRQYSRALKFTTRALELSPRCPLALWDYAGTLQMLARDAEAIAIYRRLIQRGPARIAKDPCGEGLARSRGLVADCHLRLGDSLHALGDEVGAERHFVKHLDMRGPGCQSIYPLKEIAVRHPTLQRLHRPKSADAHLRRHRGLRPE